MTQMIPVSSPVLPTGRRRHIQPPRPVGHTLLNKLLISTFMAAVWGLSVCPANAAPIIPGGYFFAGGCGTGFGSCSGSTSYTGNNGVGSYQLDWEQDHFNLLARASANSTTLPGAEDANVNAVWGMEMMIPPQKGLVAGDPVYFTLSYHLDGRIAADWADNFVVGPAGPLNVAFTRVIFSWDSTVADGTGKTKTRHFENLQYMNNHYSIPINDNLTDTSQVYVGRSFIVYQIVSASVHTEAGLGPSIGYAEVDLSHTGILGPATVTDIHGNLILNPVIASTTGFDFANPQGSATPEPAAGFLLLGGLAGVAARKLIAKRFMVQACRSTTSTTSALRDLR